MQNEHHSFRRMGSLSALMVSSELAQSVNECSSSSMDLKCAIRLRSRSHVASNLFLQAWRVFLNSAKLCSYSDWQKFCPCWLVCVQSHLYKYTEVRPVLSS